MHVQVPNIAILMEELQTVFCCIIKQPNSPLFVAVHANTNERV